MADISAPDDSGSACGRGLRGPSAGFPRPDEREAGNSLRRVNAYFNWNIGFYGRK